MTGISRTVCLLSLLTAVAGCDPIFGICETYAVSAIGVTVVDSVTAGPLTADTIWGRARDGEYVDSMLISTIDRDEPPITSFAFALERPGVYEVAIGATGYRTWTKRGVEVADGRCHVEPASLMAKLQPAG